jgi:glycopeptide antibiotics resistance protein
VEEFNPDWTYVKDVMVNIAGFVPLGVVLCAYVVWTKTPKTAILYTILAAASMSFVVEVRQAYIPRRVSGMTDIITNTLGAALGAFLARSAVVNGILGRMKLMPTSENSVPRQH